jgi:hypothetical protein
VPTLILIYIKFTKSQIFKIVLKENHHQYPNSRYALIVNNTNADEDTGNSLRIFITDVPVIDENFTTVLENRYFDHSTIREADCL